MKKTRRRVRRSRNTAVLRLVIVLLVLGLGSVGAIAAYALNTYRSNNKMMMDVVERDGIYKNIFINNVDVSELSFDAANLVLQKEFIPKLQENKVIVSADEHTLELDFAAFSVSYDFSEAVAQAYDYGRDGTLQERYNKIIALEQEPYHITYTPIYTYDKLDISAMLQPLSDAIDIEPVDASISRKDGQFILTDSRMGRAVNIKDTSDMVLAVLDTGKSGEVVAVIDEISPTLEKEDFEDAQSKIGSFVTKVTPGSTGRNANVKNALSKINDVVLHPDEVFSTNKHFGSMTYDNGYRPAPVIVNGKMQDDFGGGVCQVSSTLYNAVLLSELEVVERRNHSIKVAYTDYGFDATLAGDYIDFKFKNDTDAPVFIEGLFLNGTDVVVNIYGREIHPPGRTLKFDKELVESVAPEAALEMPDPNLPLGQRVEKVKALTGYRYNVYKTVYQDGEMLERVQVNTSYYRPRRAEVLVGTGEGEETQVVVESPVENLDAIDPAPIQPSEIEDEIVSNDPPADPIEASVPETTPVESTPEATPVESTPETTPEEALPVMELPVMDEVVE